MLFQNSCLGININQYQAEWVILRVMTLSVSEYE